MKPQLDSPTASKESFKMLMAVAANSGFKLASVDIRVAFLQSKVLDREVFIEPPSDVKKQGWIWKLRKPLYGLDDALRKFWLCVKEVFLCELGLQTIHGDEAFYYSNVEGSLQGAILTHVDDFYIAGTPDFVKRVIDHIGRELTVSKIEEDCFRFTGLDIKKVDNGIKVSMEDYTNSLEDIKEIRKVEDRNEPLTKLEMKEYRKMTGKIAWLAYSTRPDLSFTAL